MQHTHSLSHSRLKGVTDETVSMPLLLYDHHERKAAHEPSMRQEQIAAQDDSDGEAKGIDSRGRRAPDESRYQQGLYRPQKEKKVILPATLCCVRVELGSRERSTYSFYILASINLSRSSVKDTPAA